MSEITFPEILSKGLSVSQEQIALLQNSINQNPNSVASANSLRPYYNTLTSGDLTKGRFYEILDASGGADFTTVGAPDNIAGTQFKANETNLTPIWGAGSLAEAKWDGATITITGTTTINTISKKFLNYGQKIRLVFSDILQITDSAGTTGDDCELVLGANVTTFAGGELELQLRNDNKFYAIAGTVGVGGGSLWQKDADFTTLTSPQQIQLSKTLHTSQIPDVPSTSNLIIPNSGNVIVFSDSTFELQRIKDKTTTGTAIQGGTCYVLDVKEGQTIKHLYGNSGEYFQIRVDANQDWTATQDMSVWIWFDATRGYWVLMGTAQGDILASNDIRATPENANAYNFASAFEIFYDFSTVDSVTNEGTAIVSAINSGSIEFSAGTLYGLKTFDMNGDPVNEYPCCENSVDEYYLHDVITGTRAQTIDVKTVVTQDTYFKAQDNGFQVCTTLKGNEITVPFKNDGTKIYPTN